MYVDQLGLHTLQTQNFLSQFRGMGDSWSQEDSWMYPEPNVSLWEIPNYKPYIVGIYGYSPQEPLENTINTMDHEYITPVFQVPCE